MKLKNVGPYIRISSEDAGRELHLTIRKSQITAVVVTVDNTAPPSTLVRLIVPQLQAADPTLKLDFRFKDKASGDSLAVQLDEALSRP